jgi:hypothetical protein
MLQKAMRKKLLEHDWVDIAKSESNPSQTLRRLRDEGNRAINDLALLAQKLPADTLKDIFNYTNISKLINSLLAETKFDSSNSAFDDIEKTRLASLMARRGIDFCIKQYGQKIETNSVLNESTIVQLNKSIDICDTIAFKMEIPQIHAVAEKEGLNYLFNLSKIEEVHETQISKLKGEDTKIFVRILENVNGTPLDVINKISFYPYDGDENVWIFEFTDILNNHGTGDMNLIFEEKAAHLSMKVQHQSIPLQCDFVIKIQNANIFVYEKKT